MSQDDLDELFANFNLKGQKNDRKENDEKKGEKKGEKRNDGDSSEEDSELEDQIDNLGLFDDYKEYTGYGSGENEEEDDEEGEYNEDLEEFAEEDENAENVEQLVSTFKDAERLGMSRREGDVLGTQSGDNKYKDYTKDELYLIKAREALMTLNLPELLYDTLVVIKGKIPHVEYKNPVASILACYVIGSDNGQIFIDKSKIDVLTRRKAETLNKTKEELENMQKDELNTRRTYSIMEHQLIKDNGVAIFDVIRYAYLFMKIL